MTMNDLSGAHRIRLAGPWQSHHPQNASRRVTLPFHVDALDGPVRISRRFNGSEGILAAGRVCLQVKYAGSRPRVQLNDSTVNMEHDSKLEEAFGDITLCLGTTNLLEVSCASDNAKAIIEANLWIFETG